MNKEISGFKNFLIISRANIQITSLPTAALGVVLAAKSWGDILSIPVLIYILLFFLTLTYSCNINCITDVEVDHKFKHHMSEAIRAIQPRTLKRIIFVEITLILVLTGQLCIIKQDITYSVALFGFLCGYAYSAPPLRIKKHGVFSPLPVIIGLYFFPIVFGWFVIAESVSVFILLFALGYALIMQGITLLNTCEDYSEDKTSDIKTLAHVLGINNALKLGSAIVLLGGILDMALFIWHKKDYLPASSGVQLLIVVGLIFLFVILFLISRTLYSLSVSDQVEQLCKAHSGKMRWWFIFTRYPLLLLAIFFVP